jgi:hypothetical protein
MQGRSVYKIKRKLISILNITWNISTWYPGKAGKRRKSYIGSTIFSAGRLLLVLLTLWPWRWRCYVSPKFRDFSELYGIKTPKSVLFIVISVSTSYPRSWILLRVFISWQKKWGGENLECIRTAHMVRSLNEMKVSWTPSGHYHVFSVPLWRLCAIRRD